MKRLAIFIAMSLISIGALKADETPPCFIQLEHQFFSFKAVEQALSLYHVQQGAWGHIVEDLQREAANIPQKVKDRSSRMRPNPFSYPFNHRAAYSTLDGALYETLVQVLDRYGIRDPESRRGIFQYLKEQSAPLIKSCLGENVPMSKIGQ